MAICKDPVVTTLKKFGYNTVRLPRDTILPLDLVAQDGDEPLWMGPLSKVWSSTGAVPSPQPGNSGNIKGQRTGSFKLDLGLKILTGLLSGFDLKGAEASAGYGAAKELNFAFDDPKVLVVTPFDIGNYLSAGSLNTKNPFVKKYVLGKKPKAYLITEILQSRKLNVGATAKKSASAGIDLGKIKAALGGKVAVDWAAASKSEVVYDGSKDLTFGFVAVQANYDSGKWYVDKIPAGAAFLDSPKRKIFGSGLVALPKK